MVDKNENTKKSDGAATEGRKVVIANDSKPKPDTGSGKTQSNPKPKK